MTLRVAYKVVRYDRIYAVMENGEHRRTDEVPSTYDIERWKKAHRRSHHGSPRCYCSDECKEEARKLMQRRR